MFRHRFFPTALSHKFSYHAAPSRLSGPVWESKLQSIQQVIALPHDGYVYLLFHSKKQSYELSDDDLFRKHSITRLTSSLTSSLVFWAKKKKTDKTNEFLEELQEPELWQRLWI